jgi:hypothetical protein
MNEELMKKYQDTITLLQYRLPGYSFNGEFVPLGETVSFKLVYYKFLSENDWGEGLKTKTFKPMKNSEQALRYFIKTAQNRVF